MTEKYWAGRCTCCDKVLTNVKKKRPVTTHSGAMKSKYSDAMPDFPFNDTEELCYKCLESINNINADLTDNGFFIPDTVEAHSYSDTEFKEVKMNTVDRLFTESENLFHGHDKRWGKAMMKGGFE